MTNKYYTCSKSDEVISCRDLEEAVNDYLDGRDEDQILALGESISVYVFEPVPMPAASKIEAHISEYIHEWLEDCYGHPDCGEIPFSERIDGLISSLSGAIKEDIIPKTLQLCSKETISIKEHPVVKEILENRKVEK